MGPTFLCELGLFFLCTLLCSGHARDAFLTVEPSSTILFIGETVSFKCVVKEGKHTDWKYKLLKDGREILNSNTNKDLSLKIASTAQRGKYSCSAHRTGSQKTKNSNIVSVTVKADKPRATLTPGSTIIPVGGSVTLTCSVGSSAGWKYEWFRRDQNTEVQIRADDQQNGVIRVSQGGIYHCRGRRGNQVYYTDKSDDVTIKITFSNKVVVKGRPSWPQIFSDETISLTCEVQEGGETTEWEYRWRGPNQTTQWTHNNYWIFNVSESSSGDYMCKSRRRDDSYSSTEWSEAFNLSVSTGKPRATLTPGSTIIPVGGNVTLTCSVGSSADWKYEWFRRDHNATEVQIRADDQQNSVIRVSERGIYRCRGRRGNPVYYTDKSDDVTIKITLPRTGNFSYSALLIVGLICGLLLILLLLCCCFKQSKDSCFASTNQTINHTINQDEARDSQHASPHQGDACLYESVKDHDDTKNVESGDVTYSLIEFKNITQKDESLLYAEVSHKRAKAKRNKEKSASAAAEEVIYSEVKSQPALDYSLLYAEISHNRAKVKIHKGKSASAAADEAVYSEVKSKPVLSNTEIK